jgi:hypothetical protein
MTRVAPALPISPKLFRHFAAITVVVTVCVAIFADGEGRDALAAQIKDRQNQNELMIAEAKAVGERTVGLNKIKASKGVVALANAGIDSIDSSETFGAPMDTGAGSSSDSDDLSPPAASRGPIAQLAAANPLSVVPPFARQLNKRPAAAQPQRPSQEQLQQLFDASRRRSGSAE